MPTPSEATVPLQPQVQADLDRLAGFNFGELHTFPIEPAREGLHRVRHNFDDSKRARPEATTALKKAFTS